MALIPMKALLESGVHFGHRTHKWHPKMKPYIFTERNGIHIIDLQKTVKGLEQAYALVRDTVSEGGSILFVGTKRQAQETIQAEAIRCGMPYVTQRWLGGMLTNWRTIRQRINELERLEKMRDHGDFERITKKEALILSREIERLDTRLGGIRALARLPEMLFIVDVHREVTAIHEANLLEIPIVAMVDTNCDPGPIDYVIPSNDDAIRAIKLIVGKMADAVLEGKAVRKDAVEEERPVEVRIPGQAAIEEEDLSDEDLLGAATLAKISTRPAVHTELEVEEEVALVAETEDENDYAPDALGGDEVVAAEAAVADDVADADEDDTAVVEDEE
ncbi:MAG TPA: 30S ribosomal protein S2 [Anaerolineales bacterium]|nr:30S ribosomal protein S2 [Anaerolineales bacterium]